jgi:hypothetical protein
MRRDRPRAYTNFTMQSYVDQRSYIIVLAQDSNKEFY